MHRLSFDDALHAGRLVRVLRIGTVAALLALACPGATAWAQTAETRADPAIRPAFREPVTLASKDGVLEVRLTARQGEAMLDTVAVPVKNFLLYDYELIRGTASDGKVSGRNLYPAPTLQVFPGERLIVVNCQLHPNAALRIPEKEHGAVLLIERQPLLLGVGWGVGGLCCGP